MSPTVALPVSPVRPAARAEPVSPPQAPRPGADVDTLFGAFVAGVLVVVAAVVGILAGGAAGVVLALLVVLLATGALLGIVAALLADEGR